MDHRILRTIEILEREQLPSLPIGELAARVNLGTSRLEHLFKDEVSVSIRQYVRIRRLIKATHLLVSTNLRISEIFYAVGFTDASNFTHAFRDWFGLSPRECRQRFRTIANRNMPGNRTDWADWLFGERQETGAYLHLVDDD
ncbi:MAG: AraC family transcriptional regulator [Thermoanaerobaculia bacterium]